MSTTVALIINIVVMIGLIAGLIFLKKKHVSFTVRVLLSLLMGVVFGAVLQLSYGATSEVIAHSNSWFAIIGTGYVRLLNMVVIPLIFVSITSAIINQDSKNLGMIAGRIIAILLITTADRKSVV